MSVAKTRVAGMSIFVEVVNLSAVCKLKLVSVCMCVYSLLGLRQNVVVYMSILKYIYYSGVVGLIESKKFDVFNCYFRRSFNPKIKKLLNYYCSSYH